jgi:cell division protein FtsL
VSAVDPAIDLLAEDLPSEESAHPGLGVAGRWARGVGLFLVVGAVTASALAVIYSKHLTRALYADLQSVERVRDEINVEYGRLLLEQSTLATHSRIDRIARGRLNMAPPSAGQVVVIGP